MPIDISEVVREVLTSALQGVGGSSNGKTEPTSSNGGHSGLKGLAAGAGVAALAPIALKKLADGLGIDGLEDALKSPGESLGGAASQIGGRLTSGAKDKAKKAVGGEGGPGEMVKDAAKGMVPGGGGGGGGGGKQDAQGVGKGRRMPIQQSVDVALPIETVYNQWTQFEEWPKFMHRVTRASQEDPCKVNFSTKIWGKTKEFTAEIETQRPNDRIKWKTSQGMNVTGVVAFRELGPNLTRIILSFDVAPGSLVEKYARGARYVKRAARADLHRFVAFIEMLENETGAWRGVIEDGELVEDHDPSYDEEREYGHADELVHGRGSDEDEESDEDEDSEDEDQGSGGPGGEQRERRSSGSRQGASSRRSGRASQAQSRSGGSSSRSAGSSSGARKSSRSGSGRSSSGSSSSRRGSGGSSSGRNSGGSRGRSASGSTSGRGSRSSGSSGGGSRGSSRTGSSSRSSSGRSSGSSSGGSRSSGRTRSRGSSQSSRSSASKGQGRSRTASSRRG